MNTTTQKKSKTNKPDDAFEVHRSLRIPAIQNQNGRQVIRDCLLKLEGVQKIDTDRKHAQLKITYNAAQIGFETIEKELNDTGYPLDAGWWSRCKFSWYRYLDENAKTNAKSKGGACCSNPSNIYANRKK